MDSRDPRTDPYPTDALLVHGKVRRVEERFHDAGEWPMVRYSVPLEKMKCRGGGPKEGRRTFTVSLQRWRESCVNAKVVHHAETEL